MKIEEGKYYLTANGEKVGPSERNAGSPFPWLIPLDGSPLYYCDGGAFCTRSHDWRIVAEWADEPIDVSNGPSGCDLGEYAEPISASIDALHIEPTPTIWRDMTPEQKVALLLAHHEGEVVEYLRGNAWEETTPSWYDSFAYRIRPEPVRKTVTLYGAGFEWGQAELPSAEDTHRITFNLVDGKPDCTSIKMEEV
jgi:hypothetical protein